MIKQVIVMRTDLNMRKGKMCAQAAHTASLWFREFLNNIAYARSTDFTPQEKEWLYGDFTKVCVGITSEEELLDIAEKARLAGVRVHLVCDLGKTEFAGQRTLTCCSVGPDENEKIDKITGHLKLL